MVGVAESRYAPASVRPRPLPPEGARRRSLLEQILPKEHGSWSLALEPVALGLVLAPSRAGACFALSVLGGFFARRPLRALARETDRDRRAFAAGAFAVCSLVALLGLAGTCLLAGLPWLAWLGPSLFAGAAFVLFDLRGENRAAAAELAGTFAFALLPAAFATLAGWSPAASIGAGIAMLARAVPTVMCVRAAIRARKTGERRSVPAVLAAGLALAAALVLAERGIAPWSLAVLMQLFAARTFLLLVFPRPALRARTLGIIESASGAAFVIVCALSWTHA